MGAMCSFVDSKSGETVKLTALVKSVAEARKRALKDNADRFAYSPKGGKSCHYFHYNPVSRNYVKGQPFTK